jgi:1-acyl-sn-glycerol-3-phosphate acyltransferase
MASLFFREIQVEGDGSVPGEGPLVYTANHPNSLVDPVLVTGFLPRTPRFLAKHNLWENRAVRPFLRLAGSIPVYRRQDKGARASQNLQTFDACYRALAEDAVIGIFPEGLSYNEPSMMPVKTGVARIVLGAEERHGPLGIKIVPVGLTFDAKNLFRSRALLTVGEAVDPSPEVTRQADDPRGARNALTARVEDALRGVTLNYGSWKEARLIERAGDLYARGPSELPDRLGMASLFEVRKKFADGYEVMKERAPERVAALARDVDAYDRMLRVTGFRDEQIVSSYPRGQVLAYLLPTLVRLLVFFPLAMVGTILNWIPYQVTRAVASRNIETPQVQSTMKIFGGIFIYPASWAVEAVLTGIFLGGVWAAATAILAPLTGYIAMNFHEERGSFWRESLNYLRLRGRRGIWNDLRKRRRALAAQVAAMAEEYRETEDDLISEGG